MLESGTGLPAKGQNKPLKTCRDKGSPPFVLKEREMWYYGNKSVRNAVAGGDVGTRGWAVRELPGHAHKPEAAVQSC